MELAKVTIGDQRPAVKALLQRCLGESVWRFGSCEDPEVGRRPGSGSGDSGLPTPSSPNVPALSRELSPANLRVSPDCASGNGVGSHT